MQIAHGVLSLREVRQKRRFGMRVAIQPGASGSKQVEWKLTRLLRDCPGESLGDALMQLKMKFALGMLTLAVIASAFAGEDSDNKTKKLMRRKLEHAQKVLEGIALNDFKEITKHGEELMQISKDAEWQAIKTPRYEVHRNEFRRAVDTLLERAKEKNLDGAALSYVDLTLSCVKCHKYVRDRSDTP